MGQYQELSANEAIPPQIDELIQDCLRPKKERLESASSFATRLAGALRPARPLSEVLTQGRLHELALAIGELTPEEFVALPSGQRALILAKVADIVASDVPQLELAAAQFLDLLVARGVLLEREDYRAIVVPAIRWGFERRFGPYVGRSHLRDALVAAAHIARKESHQVLSEEVGRYFREVDFADNEDWYLNGVRQVVNNLLANPVCTSDPTELVQILNAVNRSQRLHQMERTSSLKLPFDAD
jgi:hypothetical protein